MTVQKIAKAIRTFCFVWSSGSCSGCRFCSCTTCRSSRACRRFRCCHLNKSLSYTTRKSINTSSSNPSKPKSIVVVAGVVDAFMNAPKRPPMVAAVVVSVVVVIISASSSPNKVPQSKAPLSLINELFSHFKLSYWKKSNLNKKRVSISIFWCWSKMKPD